MTNLKKFVAVAALALALVSCGNGADTNNSADTNKDAASTDTNAEKTGEATVAGYGGDMKVTVTMKGDTIEDIKVDHQETEGIGADAVPELVAAMKDKNSTEVDNVSGATVTSEALKQGVNEAIKNAK